MSIGLMFRNKEGIPFSTLVNHVPEEGFFDPQTSNELFTADTFTVAYLVRTRTTNRILSEISTNYFSPRYLFFPELPTSAQDISRVLWDKANVYNYAIQAISKDLKRQFKLPDKGHFDLFGSSEIVPRGFVRIHFHSLHRLVLIVQIIVSDDSGDIYVPDHEFLAITTLQHREDFRVSVPDKVLSPFCLYLTEETNE